MRFTQDFIEKVRDANNLVEIISQHTELRRTGDRLMGRCPFPDHAEKTASFSVSEGKQLYHCFGCKKSGNVFTFLETFNGMSFRESVEYLAKRASISIPVDESRKGARGDGREVLANINKLAGQYFHQQLLRLPDSHPAVAYARARGLSPEIIETFRLGIALEAWEGLVTYLTQKRVPAPMAESLGLIKRKKTGQGYFDLFRERLIFPIFSPSDELLGFGGRTYTDQNPKYLNSPETALFSKGRVLYGLHETGRYIRSEDQAIVVEGYMDAIALYAAGVKNVVAILGTAFTPDHAKLLKRYTSNVVMLLDGDSAGMNAAERSLPILLQAGLLVKGCFLPGGVDPDDYVRANGADALREELAKAPELFNLVIGRWLEGYRGSASEKVKLVDQAFPVLKAMENKQLRELYIVELAQRLDVDQPWLSRAFAAVAQRERVASAKLAAVPSAASAKGPTPVGGAGVMGVGALTGGSGSRRPGDPPPSGAARPARAATHAVPLIAEETAAPAGVDESTALLPEEDTPRQLISVKGAPRDEAFVLSLALHNESLLQDIQQSGDDGFLDMLSHSGIREVFVQALETYGQRPAAFDRLAASLASQIDQPSVLMGVQDLLRRAAESENRTDIHTEERRLMAEYVNAIRKRYYDQKLRLLANQMRNQPNSDRHQEMLEQFMNIQKARHTLDREQS